MINKRTREIVERAFDIRKRTFPCLLQGFQIKLLTTVTITVTYVLFCTISPSSLKTKVMSPLSTRKILGRDVSINDSGVLSDFNSSTK